MKLSALEELIQPPVDQSNLEMIKGEPPATAHRRGQGRFFLTLCVQRTLPGRGTLWVMGAQGSGVKQSQHWSPTSIPVFTTRC